jgi:ABC-type amino acid transport substrate-binding protein
MKRILFAFLCSASLFAEETLVVGTTSGYAPYVSLNEQGAYEGFDIDVANLLAQKLVRKLIIKDCGSMPSLMLALKQDKVDALIWAISITEERQKNMEMIYYQGEKVTEMPFLFWKQIPSNIHSIDDLGQDPKKSICVEAGTFQEAVIKKSPTIKFKNVDKITDAILELRYGKSFATAIDPSLVSRFQAQYPEIKVLRLPLPPSHHSLGNGICISKKKEALVAQVKQAVTQITAEGKIVELEKKWNLSAP